VGDVRHENGLAFSGAPWPAGVLVHHQAKRLPRIDVNWGLSQTRGLIDGNEIRISGDPISLSALVKSDDNAPRYPVIFPGLFPLRNGSHGLDRTGNPRIRPCGYRSCLFSYDPNSSDFLTIPSLEVRLKGFALFGCVEAPGSSQFPCDRCHIRRNFVFIHSFLGRISPARFSAASLKITILRIHCPTWIIYRALLARNARILQCCSISLKSLAPRR